MQCKTHLVECLNNIGVIVNVESSSVIDDDPVHGPKLALVESKDHWFGTKNNPNSWWQIDFKGVVSVHSYLLMTYSQCWYTNHFIIKISMDNKTYTDVNGHDFYPSGVYQLGQTYSARYIRIYGNADSSCNSDVRQSLAFNYVLFYGSIYRIKHFSCNCRYRSRYTLVSQMILFVVSS